MNENYRNEASKVARETRWTFLRFLPIFIVVVIILSVLGFGLRSVGLIGSTVVERTVFKQSFQYKEGMEQRAAILGANISEIDILLRSNPENKQDLINQKSILTAQLRAITINQ